MLKQTAWRTRSSSNWITKEKPSDQLHPHHYSKVFFNGTVANVDINVLDFSSAVVTRKSLTCRCAC